MEQYILNIRIIIIIIGTKKINSIFDTESKIIHFMVSDKFIIAKIKCWPVFKQDPKLRLCMNVFKVGFNTFCKKKNFLVFHFLLLVMSIRMNSRTKEVTLLLILKIVFNILTFAYCLIN